MIEAESLFHMDLWEQLTFRSMGREKEEKAWIAGTTADKCVATRKGWHVETVTGRHV